MDRIDIYETNIRNFKRENMFGRVFKMCQLVPKMGKMTINQRN